VTAYHFSPARSGHVTSRKPTISIGRTAFIKRDRRTGRFYVVCQHSRIYGVDTAAAALDMIGQYNAHARTS
jgi:hypothetical protein